MNEPTTLTPDLREAVHEALSHYLLSCADLKLLASGQGLVFRVRDDDGRCFVLRLHTPELTSETGLRTQLEWLEALMAETDLVVPRPVPLATGARSGTVDMAESSLRFHLLEWVEGERVPGAKDFVEPERLRAIGEVVARLHLHAAGREALLDGGLRVLDAEALVGSDSCVAHDRLAELASADEIRSLRRSADLVAAFLEEIPWRHDTFGIIHGDLEPQNWVFRGAEPRPIDFGECAVGLFAFDLLGVLWTHCRWEGYAGYRSALLRGYESHTTIPDEIRSGLDLLQAATLFHWLNFVVLVEDRHVRQELGGHIPSTVASIRSLVERGSA